MYTPLGNFRLRFWAILNGHRDPPGKIRPNSFFGGSAAKFRQCREDLQDHVSYVVFTHISGHQYCTALVWAAGRGATEIVSALLERGAKTELGDKFGTTPLIWASRAGHVPTGQPNSQLD